MVPLEIPRGMLITGGEAMLAGLGIYGKSLDFPFNFAMSLNKTVLKFFFKKPFLKKGKRSSHRGAVVNESD